MPCEKSKSQTRLTSAPYTSASRRTMNSPKSYGVNKNTGHIMKINLNQKEREICDLLHDVALNIKKTDPNLPSVELRVAGGWVRDKLLGLESHDLDIAINSMLGYEFALHVNQYLKQKGYTSKHVTKIASNPDKSKHLETATSMVFGMSLDFVNLRGEVRDESTNNLEVSFGTPAQDAFHRDITINALFYNILHKKLRTLRTWELPI
ncbi:CCA tRNA nucleotidyltransferase, mitochondrial [Basidiobolus ranarum]|uniref:CCA tRNA nucleotidyltransferase, mitochondrial n=1 Tax=Basidiobolus ranarum TaxID=34480 RepID=A0ABR2WV12_9FUNG